MTDPFGGTRSLACRHASTAVARRRTLKRGRAPKLRLSSSQVDWLWPRPSDDRPANTLCPPLALACIRERVDHGIGAALRSSEIDQQFSFCPAAADPDAR